MVGETEKLVNHLFRRQAGQMVSTLTRILGSGQMDLAENVVQESLLKALKTWPYSGIPDNPGAWLVVTAKNCALDILRREKSWSEKSQIIKRELEHFGTGNWFEDDFVLESDIHDDQLKMIFMACHPEIPKSSQAPLVLKSLGGMSISEIARGLFLSEDAVEQRITRAKRKIKQMNLEFDIPYGEHLKDRVDTVHDCLYLLFNEGYSATKGDRLIKSDLCDEAIRLSLFFYRHPTGKSPKTAALLALFHFQRSRFEARLDADGNIVLLQEQKRETWERGTIAEGFAWLKKSMTATELSTYHLEAGIASCHAIAASFEQTNWSQVIHYYDQLIEMNPSPVIKLNMAVAVAMRDGADKALGLIKSMQLEDELASYFPFYATLGELELRRGNKSLSREHFRDSLRLVQTAVERKFIQNKIVQ